MKTYSTLKKIRVFLVLALFIGNTFSVRSQNGWEHISWMEQPTMGSGSCVIDSLIYVFGGSDANSSTVKSVLVYNTVTNNWEQKRDLIIKVATTNVGLINDKVVLVGGWLAKPGLGGLGSIDRSTDLTFLYNPDNNTWTRKNSALKKSGGNASCVLNNKLYLFGGLKDTLENLTGQKDVHIYDPATNEWEELLPGMNNIRGKGATACVYDGKVYVFGGGYYIYKSNHYTAGKPERYDPLENSWTDLAEMPVPVLNHGSVVYNNKIYILGGDTIDQNEFPVSFIQEYDPLTDSWRLMENMPFALSNAVCQKVDNFVYIIGGYLCSSRLSDDVWRLNLDDLQEGCKEVSIREPSKSLFPGSTYTLQADVRPLDFVNKTVSWSSDNEAVAKIDSITGILTCIDAGTATLSAKLKYGNCSGSYTLKVKEGYPELIIQEPSKPLVTGDNYALHLTSVFPDGTIVWSSENEKVATVTENGVVSCLSGGTARIIATHIVGGSSDSYLLKVIDSAWVLMNKQDPGGAWTCVVDSMIYSFGGGGNSEIKNVRNKANSYNTTTNEWTKLASLPVPSRTDGLGWIGGIGQIGNKIYLVGSWRTNILEYDFVNNTFTLTDGHYRFWPYTYCMMNGKMYLFGTSWETHGSLSFDAKTYDPVSKVWDTESLPASMYFRYYSSAEVLDGNIYVLGGIGRLGFLVPFEQADPQPSEKFDGEKWEPIAEMPVPVAIHTSIVYDNRIIVFGGYSKGEKDSIYPVNSIQEYDPATDSWQLMEPMPFQRSEMVGGKVGKYMFLMGGYPGREPFSLADEVWRFNLDSLKPMSSAVSNSNLVNLNEVTIYPNPANMQITIETGISGNYNIYIRTLNGQLLLGKEVEGTEHQLDFSSYPGGVYFITIRSKDYVTTRKIIKY